MAANKDTPQNAGAAAEDPISKPADKPALAVALTYDQERPPFVSATGRGYIAEEIIRVAEEHGILIHEDPALVESLALLDLGTEIPEALYQAIAEVISFAYSLRTPQEIESLQQQVSSNLSRETAETETPPPRKLPRR